MPETEDQRAARALLLAEQRGRETAEVKARIDSHEIRLDAINGSIERGATAAEALSHRVAELAGAFAQKSVIDETRAKDAREAAANQVDKRTLIFSVIGATGVLAAVLSGVLALLQGSGHG